MMTTTFLSEAVAKLQTSLQMATYVHSQCRSVRLLAFTETSDYPIATSHRVYSHHWIHATHWLGWRIVADGLCFVLLRDTMPNAWLGAPFRIEMFSRPILPFSQL